MVFVLIVFFKQKTAYEMRISDWSSDVCSSDLAAGDDPDPIRRNFLEQRAFHGTMSMGHALGADHDMICGHEVIGLAGPDERMILFAETQIFLLIKPLRLDAGYKARIGAHGDIDVPGLERAHHLIAAERKGSVEIGSAECRDRGG